MSLELAKKAAKSIWNLIPIDPQDDRGEFDVAMDCINSFDNSILSDYAYESEKDLAADLALLDDDRLVELANQITDKIRTKFLGMEDFSVLDDYSDVKKTYWVIYVNSGRVRYVLTWFDTYDEAKEYEDTNGSTYIDANDFEWYTEIEEEYTTAEDLQSRTLPASHRIENRESDDLMDDDFDW